MDNQTIDKLAWIYIKDRKVLGTRSKGKDAYYIPGGKRESGESDHQALLREVKEELTVDLLPNSLKFFNKFRAQAHGKPEGVLVQMTCYTADFTGNMTPSAEVEELYWLTYKDRNTEKTSPVDKLILDYLKEQNLID